MKHPFRALAAATAATLLTPAAALAHPSAYAIDAKTAPTGVTNPTWEQLGEQRRYVLANHGFPVILRETNGAPTGGMLNYALMPGAYRSGLTREQKLDPKHATGAQPHATCEVGSLTNSEAVLSWQEADPFYTYIPFQATSAGLDDDPATWLTEVKNRTGVDLTTVSDPATACAGIGGTYRPADETQSTAAAFLSGYTQHLVEPLEAQIAAAESAKDAAEYRAAAAESRATSAEAQIAQAKADAAAAQAKADGLARRLAISAPASAGRAGVATRGIALTVTGPPSLAVKVRLLVSPGRAQKLGLKSRSLGTVGGTTGGDYSLPLTLRLRAKAAKAIRGARAKSFAGVLEARGDDRIAVARVRLTR